jgi:hypothetical protein
MGPPPLFYPTFGERRLNYSRSDLIGDGWILEFKRVAND